MPVLVIFPGEPAPRPAVLAYQVGDWCVIDDPAGERWQIHRSQVTFPTAPTPAPTPPKTSATAPCA